jgi:hypothetical protein
MHENIMNAYVFGYKNCRPPTKGKPALFDIYLHAIVECVDEAIGGIFCIFSSDLLWVLFSWLEREVKLRADTPVTGQPIIDWTSHELGLYRADAACDSKLAANGSQSI